MTKENGQSIDSAPGIICLMYHRIDIMDTDPWSICVSPQHFEEQIQFLKQNFDVISVPDVVSQITTGNIKTNSVCLTFDDGYADNYIYAKPILERHDCPATFFIPTAFISIAQPFWWDELEIILLHSKKLPEQLTLSIAGESLNYTLSTPELTDEQWQQHKVWKWYEEPPTDRCAVFLNVWETLRILSHEEIKYQIKTIKEWADNQTDFTKQRLPMNEDQLCELAANNLFTIGLHTHTHPDLSAKEKNVQAEEIMRCKHTLYNKYSIEANCLAYPYGRYNNDTAAAAAELLLTAGFTTEPSHLTANSHLMKLGRYQVCNWNMNEFQNQISAWHEYKK